MFDFAGNSLSKWIKNTGADQEGWRNLRILKGDLVFDLLRSDPRF